MNRIIVASSGSYPRIGKGSVGHRLRSVWHAYDREEVGMEGLEYVQDLLAEEIVREQEHIGLHVVTDGLVRWYCPVSHIAGKLEGVDIGSLHHFLDTNFHIRKAIVRSIPQWTVPLVAPEVKFARGLTKRTVKAVLTGPVTLTHYTENRTSYPAERILEAYTCALAREIELLVEEGCAFIHIDDPLLLWEEFPYSYCRDLYAVLRNASPDVFLELKVYGRACGDSLYELLSFPVDCVGLDCIADPKLFETLLQNSISKRPLSLGVVDSRTKVLESPDMIARQLEGFVDICETLIIEPSCGLELNTRRYAREKLRILVKVRELLLGGRDE